MNSVYYYRSGKKYTNGSGEELCRVHVPKRRERTSIIPEEMNLDTLLALICSERVLGCARAIFGAVSIVGLVGIIRDAELGLETLVSGCVCLTLVMLLEFLTREEN